MIIVKSYGLLFSRIDTAPKMVPSLVYEIPRRFVILNFAHLFKWSAIVSFRIILTNATHFGT